MQVTTKQCAAAPEKKGQLQYKKTEQQLPLKHNFYT
jgi:hypothetical protein